MKVAHVIIGLHVGGTETVLRNLIGATPGVEHSVISVMPEGPLAKDIRGLGASVKSLNMGRNLSSLAVISKLRRVLRVAGPDIVSTWMYHSNFLGLFATRKPLIWNIRNILSGARM